MAELIPAPFADLVTRLHREPAVQHSLFGLPERKWWLPNANSPDLTACLHGHLAGNPLGPAAGPHTQMAQNLLLSYAAGARILELKTVQVNDRLTIGRPCIDMTNVGYNIEWSQELRVEESAREYVAGAMLVRMFRAEKGDGSRFEGPAGDVIYDLSVGYDLEGIRSAKVQLFLDAMRDARVMVDRLRGEIPAEFAAARDADYPERISDSVTLSTFHGCPAGEIERICEFLLAERDLDVIVKMNPPMLGRERLEHLLHDVMGYAELRVNPKAYTSGLLFDEALQLCERLTRFAASRGRRLGFKFSNTLEVVNHRTFFAADNEVMYLSGQPLHVITMTLTDAFRHAVGPHVPISFSAGIDRQNFATAVACGFVPITVSTDLLRPGGYGRLADYFPSLQAAMSKVGARTIDEFILRACGQEAEARRRAAAERDDVCGTGVPPVGDDVCGTGVDVCGTGVDVCGTGVPPVGVDRRDAGPTNPVAAAAVRWAGLLNTTIAAKAAQDDPRYRAAANRKIPPRMDSHLVTFDCITCDKCIPVCPNAANFTYPTPQVAFDFRDLIVDPAGGISEGPVRRFEITEPMQIACYADFCNECGNCDTFCPEYGGPYIKKPSFFGGMESWRQAAPRDGFVVGNGPEGSWIRGRIQGAECELAVDSARNEHRYRDGTIESAHALSDHALLGVRQRAPITSPHRVDMGVYHTLRHLLAGVLDGRFVNQVNANWESGPRS